VAFIGQAPTRTFSSAPVVHCQGLLDGRRTQVGLSKRECPPRTGDARIVSCCCRGHRACPQFSRKAGPFVAPVEGELTGPQRPHTGKHTASYREGVSLGQRRPTSAPRTGSTPPSGP